MEKNFKKNPTLADIVLIDILTPTHPIISNDNIEDQELDCFEVDPFRVDNVTIYFLERSSQSSNFGEYLKVRENDSLKKELNNFKKKACISPTEENLFNIERLQTKINSTSIVETIFFSDAVVVDTLGTEDFPAWLSTDQENSRLNHITEDENGNPIFGRFLYRWNPLGQREGDYLVSWTWTPIAGGEKVTKTDNFFIKGSSNLTNVPTHITDPEKYSILLERYTPEFLKTKISSNDLSPKVIKGFNDSVGDLFKFIEDFANQLIDLLDSNFVNEHMLQLLANMFGLKLKSSDPTLWRRQIKEAIPLYKNKGTLNGLKKALSQSGINLINFIKLWQVQSKYTYQEAFEILEDDQNIFNLTKEAIVPIDEDNFELYYRSKNENNWNKLNSDYINLNSDHIEWIGNDLSFEPISLEKGDWIRIIYKINEVPNSSEQEIEDYIRLLTLSDDRDERNQKYPLKNWNIRLIEETDPLFDVIVETRHPYNDPVIWGKIRTIFEYSENIYNMDEYNGSIRDSTNPCDIDKDFMDFCKQCLSSKFNLDLEIENLDNFKIFEVQDIIKEYVPFHSRLHNITINGLIQSFVPSPNEELKLISNAFGNQVTVVNSQSIFHRAMKVKDQKNKNELATGTIVKTGTANWRKTNITFYSPNVNFSKIGLDLDNPTTNTLLNVKSGIYEGKYVISGTLGSNLSISDSSPDYSLLTSNEPLNDILVPFEYSNIRVKQGDSGTGNALITQDNLFNFNDVDFKFHKLNIKTKEDDSVDFYKLEVLSPGGIVGEYDIERILPNGNLDLSGLVTNDNFIEIEYLIKNNNEDVILSGTNGVLKTTKRGLVDLTNNNNNTQTLVKNNLNNFNDIEKLLTFIDDTYLIVGSSEYKIIGFKKDEKFQFYIQNWSSGTSVTSIEIHEKVVFGLGHFGYYGIEVDLSSLYGTNFEDEEEINNGNNPPAVPLENNSYKENFLIKHVDSDTFFYIKEVDENNVLLEGPIERLTNVVSVNNSLDTEIHKFEKESFSVPENFEPHEPGQEFQFIDKRGQNMIELKISNPDNEDEDIISINNMVEIQNYNENNSINTFSEQEEEVFLSIEYKEEDNNDKT